MWLQIASSLVAVVSAVSLTLVYIGRVLQRLDSVERRVEEMRQEISGRLDEIDEQLVDLGNRRRKRRRGTMAAATIGRGE